MKSFSLTNEQYKAVLQLIPGFVLQKTKFFTYKTTKRNGVRINLYNTKKIVFQGGSTEVKNILDWITRETRIELEDNQTTTKGRKKMLVSEADYWGGDESGKGDFFGPITLTLILTNEASRKEFRRLQIRDSKKMSDEQIKVIAPQIMRLKNSVLTGTITNEKLAEKLKQGKNLNEVLATSYQELMVKAAAENKQKTLNFVIDGFVEAETWERYQRKWGWANLGQLQLTFRGESSHIGVAAASIVSRYLFLCEIDRISKELGTKVQLGASLQTRNQLNELIEKYGLARIASVAKVHYKH